MKEILEERGRCFTYSEYQNIARRVYAFASDGGDTSINMFSWLNGELRWARNRVNLASDRCNVSITISRRPHGWAEFGGCSVNQIDDVSLEAAIRCAERRSKDRDVIKGKVAFDGALRSPELLVPVTAIWSDTTAAVSGEDRAGVARMLTEEAEAKGMLSAGYLEMRSGSKVLFSSRIGETKKDPDDGHYQRLTQAQCSMTVRHPRGTGSGWAGASSFDIARVDGLALARRALDKCLASIDPVRIEPGRFTVILEPQAVSDLLSNTLIGDEGGDPRTLDRVANENPQRYPAPFFLAHDDALRLNRTKLGLKIVDERITISHDPVDPVLGVVPSAGLKPITWIQNGVLTSLHHNHEYATNKTQRFSGDLYRPSFRISGGGTTVEDMIATTKRGLLVTRFSGVIMIDPNSLLATGTTRDGLWLIENGAITKAVWNMRFTESPLFAFNQIDQLGVPQPIFRPVKDVNRFSLTPTVVPAMKINDFSFTSLVDAV